MMMINDDDDDDCVICWMVKHRIHSDSMSRQERYVWNAGNASTPRSWRYIWTFLLRR